ncbi:penicillin-insensitive murein endopeptidase [Rhodobacter capsulatus]|jgi:penicillin-insensitive murein endopeptidase|uniref:Penicillin-insensitive murein endopeptidase MepA n=1 Tax=Rhodobacter capsulatus (strain ATCC BAA-309 / NBRC 16581 / SB1003) TaxID=272942 RepID=D5ASU0_RHOCB|nr:penicillin-insensitive murein endopeptidase [Rhodobacter capsulatus]ADE87181.1 penicillin-insensitive murein endopeptidase MepA [Rhodobacter capsulatus SB 1003]ETD03408.1 peptidase [Rhodobacter capsulatus DE442]ETD80203.1 peptidase [Rhodobacter capsulatus R121]ETE55467.1 peptidase [Rhodobacter capsulatus Y262]MDS0925278.1 penicillin-insensitive murein endopeptidase [Rhodobacter capsulatus]
MTPIRLALAAALVALAPLSAGAEPLARQLFGAQLRPTQGASEPIGAYSRGCAAGLVALPETGPTWQAMRLKRNRNWGQPELVAYLQDLSAFAATLPGWRGLYIGDLSQPRGGPMTGGHASHQIGLDADIWMLPATRLDLSAKQREKISSISIRTEDQIRVNRNWTPQHAALLRAAASDPRVDRVFVAAAAKLAMCATATRADTAWLQKIRPIYGHNEHFHVRLKCPPGARLCEGQKPTVAELSKGGNGCDETLTWWVTTYLEELRHPPKRQKPSGPAPKNAKTYVMSDLPAQCQNVLSAR